MICSKNFHIVLWNGDMLCMWDVMSNWDLSKWIYPIMIKWEDFLIKVANFALELAENNLINNKIYD